MPRRLFASIGALTAVAGAVLCGTGEFRAAPPQCRPTSIVLPGCRLTVMEKQDVPSQRDGVILFIGTELEAGQTVPAEQIVTVRLGGEEKRFRRLQEGDVVQPGQLVGYLDDQYSRDEWAIKQARLAGSRADLEAAMKSAEESKNRYDTQVWLRKEGRGATSEEDVRTARLTWDRATFEALSKRQSVALAERELSQAETVLRMHQLRAGTAGVIKTVYRKPGEAIHSLDPVVQIHHLARLRIEGAVDGHLVSRLRPGMRAFVEPCQAIGPRQTLVGHLDEVSAVAVTKDSTRIVSAGLDSSVRVWDRTGKPLRVLPHPAKVLAVACSPTGASGNLALTGAADGIARVWDLDGNAVAPVREISHGSVKGSEPGWNNGSAAIAGVAFSPDGKRCATGGEDWKVRVWDVSTGAMRQEFAVGSAVTSLQFRNGTQIVVATSQTSTVQLWTLADTGATRDASFSGRSGAVPHLGISADGRHVLYDQGSTLQLLGLPEGCTEGTVQNTPRGNSFGHFALFAPDGRSILAAGGDGAMHLWRSPATGAAATQVRHLMPADAMAPTCAAFSPDGTFVAVGGRDRRVRLWPVPSAQELEVQRTAVLTFVDRAVESSTHEARIWAELANPDGRLLPGTTVTLVLDGEEP
ncbi:MAG: HlyD family efflux transporter periplasmic adaptor subunit [Gemmataceae bacterium]|nr:HlyD family efflux transporter periplasmic adaptor subunit [Gemmataceae bacterium]